MAELWSIPEVNECWLPDEGACPPVVQSVRSFMGNRLPHAEGESRSEDQRNIKGFFSKLGLHDSPKADPKEVDGVGTSSLMKLRRIPAEHLASQCLASDAADTDLDQSMGSDNSMLDQSRESFYGPDS